MTHDVAVEVDGSSISDKADFAQKSCTDHHNSAYRHKWYIWLALVADPDYNSREAYVSFLQKLE